MEKMFIDDMDDDEAIDINLMPTISGQSALAINNMMFQTNNHPLNDIFDVKMSIHDANTGATTAALGSNSSGAYMHQSMQVNYNAAAMDGLHIEQDTNLLEVKKDNDTTILDPLWGEKVNAHHINAHANRHKGTLYVDLPNKLTSSLLGGIITAQLLVVHEKCTTGHKSSGGSKYDPKRSRGAVEEAYRNKIKSFEERCNEIKMKQTKYVEVGQSFDVDVMENPKKRRIQKGGENKDVEVWAEQKSGEVRIHFKLKRLSSDFDNMKFSLKLFRANEMFITFPIGVVARDTALKPKTHEEKMRSAQKLLQKAESDSCVEELLQLLTKPKSNLNIQSVLSPSSSEAYAQQSSMGSGYDDDFSMDDDFESALSAGDFNYQQATMASSSSASASTSASKSSQPKKKKQKVKNIKVSSKSDNIDVIRSIPGKQSSSVITLGPHQFKYIPRVADARDIIYFKPSLDDRSARDLSDASLSEEQDFDLDFDHILNEEAALGSLIFYLSCTVMDFTKFASKTNIMNLKFPVSYDLPDGSTKIIKMDVIKVEILVPTNNLMLELFKLSGMTFRKEEIVIDGEKEYEYVLESGPLPNDVHGTELVITDEAPVNPSAQKLLNQIRKKIDSYLEISSTSDINFEGFSLTGSIFNEVIGVIPKLAQNLKSVRLGQNKIDSHDAIKLFEILKSNNSIENVDLKWNAIDDDCIPYLLDMLDQNNSIRTISLAHNQLSRDGIEKIEIYIKDRNSLRFIDLSANTD